MDCREHVDVYFLTRVVMGTQSRHDVITSRSVFWLVQTCFLLFYGPKRFVLTFTNHLKKVNKVVNLRFLFGDVPSP